MQIKLLMISQNLKPDESIVIPKRDMAEAARGGGRMSVIRI